MNWKETHIDLGNLKENKKYHFEFESVKELDISLIKPGCGSCTIINGYRDNKLTVTFKSSTIPYHLNKNKLTINKTITITYQDETSETLSFSGTVKK